MSVQLADRTPQTLPPPTPTWAGRELLTGTGVLLVSLLLGGLTAIGQELLPGPVAPLANSAGPWVVTAFGLAVLARHWWSAAVFSAVSLASLLAGYVIADGFRGHPSASSMIAFWGLAAFGSGPVIGLAGYWLRIRSANLAAIGVGVISGVLVGEAIHGLTALDQPASFQTTGYWAAELIGGVLLLLLLAASRFRGALPFLLAVLSCVVLTAVFLSITVLGLIQYLG